MKKIFTLSASLIFAMALFSSCVKEHIEPVFDENYWLSKEEGEVVYSDPYCDYFVVETYYGYNIVRTNESSKPYEGDFVYGNFSNTGTRDLYNYSGRFVFTGTVTDYWLTYNETLDALDYYCPYYGKGIQKRVLKESTKFKKK